MTRIEDLLKFKEFQEKKLYQKVEESLLEKLVDFYISKREAHEDYFKEVGKVKTKRESNKLGNLWRKREKEFRERDTNYFFLIQKVCKEFICYNHYTYRDEINWNLVFVNWAIFKKRQAK